MASDHLATYLNDHLAGATAALELLEHLQESYADGEVKRFAAALHADIAADRRELESLMSRLHVSPSRSRRATAWLGERVTELKLRLDDPEGGSLRLLEAMEVLSLGIEGKRLLWRSLASAAADASALQGLEYDLLTQRAVEQRERIEPVRLAAARAALGNVPRRAAAGA